MEHDNRLICEHQWRYYVDVVARAVRARRCERCGVRMLLAANGAVREPELAVAGSERLTA